MVSVGQPLDVAVTLPQRGGGWVSEPCGPERASPSLLLLVCDQFLITAFASGNFCRSSPRDPTSNARRECVLAPKRAFRELSIFF